MSVSWITLELAHKMNGYFLSEVRRYLYRTRASMHASHTGSHRSLQKACDRISCCVHGCDPIQADLIRTWGAEAWKLGSLKNMSPMFWQCSGGRVSQAGTGFLAKQAAIFVICLASGAHDIPIQRARQTRLDEEQNGSSCPSSTLLGAQQLWFSFWPQGEGLCSITCQRMSCECILWACRLANVVQTPVLWLCQAAPSLHAHMHSVS